MTTRLLALALAAGWFMGSCEEPDPVILALQDEQIRRSDFQRHLAAVEARGLGPLAPEARQGLLESFLEEQVLLIEARHQGLLEPDAPAEEVPLAVARLLAEAIPAPEVREDEILAYYEAHAPEFRVPETVTVRQILVDTLNEARDLKRRLYRDSRAFETLAGTRSKGPEATVGGYMGTFERGQLPEELEKAAFALAPGRTSQPIQSSLGYHVLRVDSRQPARELSLEEARGWIRERLSRERADAAARAYVAGLLSRAKVDHEAALSTTSSH
jgi:parvulin-like peptidyl-prolyl isomerase